MAIGRDESRQRVYGMPYDEWKRRHQTEMDPAKAAAFKATHGH